MLTLEQLKVGIPFQCEILFEEDEVHAQVLLYRKDTEEDPVVSIPVTKIELQSGYDRIMDEVQTQLCNWLDEQGFADYAFVLGSANNSGCFVVKLDPEVHKV